jgi:hypothetical protein
MNAAMNHLKRYFADGSVQRKGKLIIGTVEGDLHDIGKNLVSMIAEGNGYEIIDLGVAFGCKIKFPENDMPHILGRLADSAEAIEKLAIPSLSAGRIPEYIKANRLAAGTITGKPVFAGMIGPFSLAGRLYDMSEIMVACYIEPEAIALLLDKTSYNKPFLE